VRIPFPERVSLAYVFCFAALLAVCQIAEGTPSEIAAYCFIYIIVAAITFNVAGGFTRTTGAYVFFYTLLTVIVGITWKAILGEPAQSNLAMPFLTFQVHLGGVLALLFAVYVSRRLTTKRALLANMVTDANMQNATTGCMITGIILTTFLTFLPHENGSILAALSQLNRFYVIAILLGVIHQIRKSGGTSSVNVPVLISMAAIFISGVLAFSKEGMFTPFICWFVAAASQRYRLSLYQLIGVILTTLFLFQYLVPYSQYGRSFITGTPSEDFDTTITMLSDLGDVRQKYYQDQGGERGEGSNYYYDTPQGFFDRLEMLSPDDGLIEVTEEKGQFGFSPIIMGFENLIPHIIWPGKPGIFFGNIYAHEVGILSEEDNTTGVSFSPMGEAFHLERWLGVFLIAPALWIMLFTLFDSLCGDVRKSPWGLLMFVVYSHLAPEGMLGGIIYMLGFVTAGLLFAAFTAAYVMPIIGTLVSGPEAARVRRILRIQSVPRRVELPLERRGLGRI
jgi:hypothetical protein